MAKNVRFVQTTKQKWLNRDVYDPTALYFCIDTGEIFKGNILFTEGVKIVPTRDALPSFECAADGVVYYITDTKAGFMISPDRTEWLQTIYAPVADVNSIPEGEEYNVVTTVGAVRDIENAIYKYVDEEISKIEVSGGQGADGKTPYIQDGYWYIDGVNTNVKAEGVDGKDGTNGKDGAPGKDGKDGVNGKDGVDGKDGDSAYQIWLNAGHTGSEDDFLQWLKGDTEPFGNVVTSIEVDGIPAGTSLNGKTVKDVLVMLLGIQEPPKSAVEYIMENSIPSYSGLEGEEPSEIAYRQLDTATANYTDQGFYTTTNGQGEITNAGYQITFDGNTENMVQTFSMYEGAKIVTAYQYQPALNQWLEMGFDETYWVESGTDTKMVNGQEVIYTTYSYNIELMGDVITAPEYWRFEVEVS